MPSLDMSDALLEPSFLDFFQVVRRYQEVSDTGRASSPLFRKYLRVMGTVMAASGNDLSRLQDYEIQGQEISIVTRFKLQGVSKASVAPDFNDAGQPQPQFQPDIILWSGSAYVVIHTDPYERFGTGFIQAIAASTTYIDDQPAPDGMVVGNYDFSNTKNSGLIVSLR